MKKNYLLFVLFALCTVLTYAQTKRAVASTERLQRQVVDKSDGTNTTTTTVMTENAPAHFQITASEAVDVKSFNFNDRVLRSPSADLQVFYPRPIGTYIYGFIWKSNGNSGAYNRWPTIVAPALKDLLFKPYSSNPAATYTWTMNKGGVDLSTMVNAKSELTFNGRPNVAYYIPELNGNVGSQTATYAYGYYDDENTPIDYQFLFSSVAEFGPITNADAWVGGLYGGWNETSFFGPKAVNEGVAQTSILSLFQKPLAPLSVKEIEILITSERAVASAIPLGKSLTLNIYQLNADGSFGDKLIATTTATASDITPVSNFGYITFNFDEVDDLGFLTPKTLLLKEAFIVELTGFDNTYDFRVLLAGNEDIGGSAYALYGNRLVSFNYEDGSNGADLFMQLIGAFNCLEFEQGQDKLTVDNAGGDATFYFEGNNYSGGILYSSYPAEDLTVEGPAWLRITDINTEDYAEYGALYVTVQGDPLPSDLTGRSGDIIISSEGISTIIRVKQGDADWSAIAPVKTLETIKAARQGDNFVLSYPATATSVAVYNIAGQKVTDYKLNANGTYTLPVGNLANGVYVLKFNDAQSTAVKILK
jgi:hypothetical protein